MSADGRPERGEGRRWRTVKMGRRPLLDLVDQPGNVYVWSPAFRRFVRAYKHDVRRHLEDAPRSAVWNVKVRASGGARYTDVYLETRRETGGAGGGGEG